MKLNGPTFSIIFLLFICVFIDCMLTRSVVVNVTIDGCRAEELIQTRCEGECPSHLIYTGLSDQPEKSCLCCTASATQQTQVNLDCGGENNLHFNVAY